MTETWSRQDIERLFQVSRPSAQNLMKAIGGVQRMGGAHFVDRAPLLDFLHEIIAASSVEEAVRRRREQAAPAPRSTPLRISLPGELRSTMIDLPKAIGIEPGRLTISADTAEAMLEALVLLAQALRKLCRGISGICRLGRRAILCGGFQGRERVLFERNEPALRSAERAKALKVSASRPLK